MELTKKDIQVAKGVAIIGMVMLHLFCRLGDLPYSPWIWVGDIPLIYYIGLLGDICVPVFCFCSGYAQYLLYEKYEKTYKKYVFSKLLRFLCNYWIVVIVFSSIGFIVGKPNIIPRSLGDFLGNILLYNINYNGAWWFVATYIFLIICSPIVVVMINKINAFKIVIISGVFYFVAYLFRFKIKVEVQIPLFEWGWDQLVLFGTSQFMYLLGMVVRKYKCVTKLRHRFGESKRKYRYALVMIITGSILIGHCFVPSLIVAPFTATAVLINIFLLEFPIKIKDFLCFLGNHSSNIWFVHMFYYLTLFEGLVYGMKYPLLITVTMFVLCICSSQIIYLIYNPIDKYLIILGKRNLVNERSKD